MKGTTGRAQPRRRAWLLVSHHASACLAYQSAYEADSICGVLSFGPLIELRDASDCARLLRVDDDRCLAGQRGNDFGHLRSQALLLCSSSYNPDAL